MISPRLLVLMLVSLAFAACDSTSPTRTLTLTLDSIDVIQSCEPVGNPGDFHFQIQVFDDTAPFQVIDLPEGSPYGVDGSFGTTLHLDSGERLVLDEAISISADLETLGIAFGMIEWDAADRRDPQANDRKQVQMFSNADGQFSNLLGVHTLAVTGETPSACEARLTYTVSAD